MHFPYIDHYYTVRYELPPDADYVQNSEFRNAFPKAKRKCQPCKLSALKKNVIKTDLPILPPRSVIVLGR